MVRRVHPAEKHRSEGTTARYLASTLSHPHTGLAVFVVETMEYASVTTILSLGAMACRVKPCGIKRRLRHTGVIDVLRKAQSP